jgi:hypothetical protein
LVVVQCKVGKLTSTLVGPTFTRILLPRVVYQGRKDCYKKKKKLQKRKEKIIMDVNAIMMDNKKKKKGASSTNPSKMITKLSLLQEGDVGKAVANADKLVATSNVVNKVIEVVIREDKSLSNVDIKKLLN